MNWRASKTMMMAAALIIALGYARASSAQVFTGRIDVTVEDSTGGRLPGVNVDLTGPATQSQVTDAEGQAHFLNLAVGTYTVKASLQGFNPKTQENVIVAAGAAVQLPIRLSVAGTQETVTVTAASPIIDIKSETTTTHVSLDELQNIPSARDPWVVMQTVPTIMVDRVNVGGSESGQQSNYFGKGSLGTDNTWNLDGVPITDMGATGSTPTYYDFDMFQEMAVTTGGADAQNPTPGVQLNMVLKKGTNVPHGSARFYFENEALQGNNLDPALARALGSSTSDCVNSNYTQHCGNRTDQYLDTGFEVGGPIFKDRLWAWGTIGRTNPKIRTLVGQIDETILKNYAFKADAQATTGIRLNFSFFEGNKIKNGRSVGPTRLIETAWNQTGPTKYYKGEGNFVMGSNLFAAVRGAYVDGGFQLAPIGGLNTNTYQDDAGVWHGSYLFYKTTRPQYYVGGDASYFAGKHEVKFGFSYRHTPIDSTSQWPGTKIITYWTTYPNMLAQAYRDYNHNVVGNYVQGFVTDTISFNRLTLTAGIRFDHQTSSNLATTVPGVPGFENLLPSLTAPEQDNVYNWNTVTPRVGVSYALDETRKTVVRGSYAMFASQLPGNEAVFVSPIQYSYVYYNAVDRNGDGVAQVNEILFNEGIQGYGGFDLSNPTALTSVNRVNQDLKVPLTHEVLVGVDREIMPNFAVSATFTWRRFNNLLWTPRIGVTQADYHQSGTYTATLPVLGSVSVPFYAIDADAIPPGGGRESTNRPGYHQRYLGFEASATKRMSNRWMARFGFSTNKWTEYFDNPSIAIEDPTRGPAATTAQPTAGPLQNGGLVVTRTSGSGKSNIYLVSPTYQFIANGLYEGPWGINLGANMVTRQGYAEPYFVLTRTGDPLIARKNVLLTNAVDQYRLPAVTSFDARVEKMFKFGRTSFAADLDIFNLFNAGTTLGRQYDASKTGPTGFNQTLEIMNPRIARIGVRFMF